MRNGQQDNSRDAISEHGPDRTAGPDATAAHPQGQRGCPFGAQMSEHAAPTFDSAAIAGPDAGGLDGVALDFVRVCQSALLIADSTGIVTFANASCERLLGYAEGGLVGCNVRLMIPERFHAAHDQGMAALVAGGAPRLAGKPVEVTAVRRDGSEFPIELSLSSWGAGARFGIGAEIRDISERWRRDIRLQRLALHDPNSGLPNRTRLIEDLDAIFSRQGRAAVLLLAVEGLRSVAGSLGNALGDALLEALAVRLRGRIPAGALLAHIGEDELAVLVSERADPLPTLTLARELVEALAEPIQVSGHLVHLSASVGVAFAPNDGEAADEVIASADLALDQARRDRTRNVRLFDVTLRSAAANRRNLQDSLRLALERRELELHYQPQVDLADGRICGAEALIRWRHPQRGLMAPGEFLPALETSTLALSVGWWIIDEACRQAAAWRAGPVGPIRIAINLFSAQLRAGTLATIVLEALERHGLPPDALELELTEIIALERDEATLAPIRALLERGVGIAFDDFGTGFASLSTLKNFPLSKLKIDRSFVRDILTDGYDAAITQAVMDLGRGLGLAVVAEGIETEAQEQALRAMGCRYGQGFLFGRALHADAFTLRIAAERADDGPAYAAAG